MVTDGATAGTNPSIPFAGMMGHGAEDTGAPKAYLNILDFNEEDELVNFAYKQISTGASEDGSDVPHENIDVYTPIYEPGYVYIYLSNESGSRVEVFPDSYAGQAFDDFRVNHAHGLIVQKDDFYPFGLSFNAYTRPGETDQKYLYNGKELMDDLDLGLYDFHARGYDPILGRTWQQDPHAENYFSLSPYSWVANNPLNVIDPTGMDTVNVNDLDMRTFNPDVDLVGLDEVVVSANRGSDESADGTKEDIPFWLLREGDKVMGHRDGISGLEDFFDKRTYGPFDVNAEGRIVGLTPTTGVGPDVGRVGAARRIKTVRDLFAAGKKLPKVKGGGQISVKGNIDDVFNSISKGGKTKTLDGGQLQATLQDGTILTKYPATSGPPTIQVNQGGKITKVRFE